jgi:hypothetical protein
MTRFFKSIKRRFCWHKYKDKSLTPNGKLTMSWLGDTIPEMTFVESCSKCGKEKSSDGWITLYDQVDYAKISIKEVSQVDYTKVFKD